MLSRAQADTLPGQIPEELLATGTCILVLLGTTKLPSNLPVCAFILTGGAWDNHFPTTCQHLKLGKYCQPDIWTALKKNNDKSTNHSAPLYASTCWVIHKHTSFIQSTNIHWDLGQDRPWAGQTKTIWHGHPSSKTQCYKCDEGKATRIENR